MKSAQRREIKTYKKKEGKKEENLKKDKKKEEKEGSKNIYKKFRLWYTLEIL